MSCRMRKPTIYIWENKDADQLHGDREADQRLCFCYTDSTCPLLLKSERAGLICAHAPILSLLCMVNAFILTPIKMHLFVLKKHF